MVRGKMSMQIHRAIGGDDPECALCSTSLGVTPIKELSCAHVFCADCLASLFQCQTAPKQLLCPICDQMAGVLGTLPKRKANVKTTTVAMYCSVCDKDANALAVAYCETCKDYMCTPCLEVHGIIDMHKLQRVVTDPRAKGVANDPSHQVKTPGKGKEGGKQPQTQQPNENNWWLEYLREFVPSGSSLWCATPTEDGRMIVGYLDGGIEIFTPTGPSGGIILGEIKVQGVAVLSDGRFVVRERDNSIGLYDSEWGRLGAKFQSATNGGFGGLTVDVYDNIYVGYWKTGRIEMFRPNGGFATKVIQCQGFEPWELCHLNRAKMLVAAGGSSVALFDEFGKRIQELFSKRGANAYPLVLDDDSILVAWDMDNNVEGAFDSFRIDLHTKQLRLVRDVFEGRGDAQAVSNKCCLRRFSTGEFAFCDFDNFVVFEKRSSVNHATYV